MPWIDGEYSPTSTCCLGGGAAGAGGTGRTGPQGASVYEPAAQPQFDTLFQSIINGTFAPLAQNPSMTPAGQAYGQFTNSPTFGALTDPALQQGGLDASQAASGYYGNGIFPGSFNQGQSLVGTGNNFTTAFNNNPYITNAIGAAQEARDMFGAPTASNAFDASQSLFGNIGSTLRGGANAAADIASQADPLRGLAPGIVGSGMATGGALRSAADALQGLGPELINAGRTAGQGIAGAAGPLQGLSQSLINTGFDPQSALYNQLRQRTMNTANVNNAFSGVGNTPYGEDVANKATSDFDINWQNQQLGREATAAQAAQGVQGQIGNLLQGGLGAQIQGASAGTGVQNAIGNLLQAGLGAQIQGLSAGTGLQNAISQLLERGVATNALGNSSATGLANAGMGLGSGATSLLASAGALPSNTYMGQLGQMLSGLSSAGNLTGQGANLGTQAAQGLSTFGGLPFSTASNMGQGLLSNLTGASNIGTAQYAIPQQTLQDLQSYLGLGQAASGISGQLGQLGQNQLMNSAGGFGSLAGSVFGNNGAFGNSGAFGSNGLFGGLFGAGAGAADAGFGSSAAGLASIGLPDASAGFLADFAPFLGLL